MPLIGINVKIFEAKSDKFLTSQKLAYRKKQISNSSISLYKSGDHTNLNIKTKTTFCHLKKKTYFWIVPPIALIILLLINIILIIKST